MLRPEVLLEQLRAQRIELASGVPCSDLAPLLHALDALAASDLACVPATNEGDAVAIAAGSALGGRLAMVTMQNSGLGNAVNPLTSLAWPYRTPMLLITSWRGEPGRGDEPQHELMGELTPALLEAMGIPWALLPQEERELSGVLEQATGFMQEERRPYALIVRPGVLVGPAPAAVPVPVPVPVPAATPTPTPTSHLHLHPSPGLELETVLRCVLDAAPDDVILASTGFSGRALVALDDRPQRLAMVGSMGCVSSLGLGLALARPERRIVVLDGDGAFLMRLGALATIGRVRPPNLLHLLLDNRVHDSTGGQPSLSSSVDAVAVASACGYPRVDGIGDLQQLNRALRRPADALSFVHVPTAPLAERRPPRPTRAPHEAAARLTAWLGATR